MLRKTTVCLVMLLGALLPLVAACGSNPATGSATPTTIPAGEHLYVLDGGQQIVAFHPSGANPVALLTLPAGLFSPDHHVLVATSTSGTRTTVSIVNPQTGATLRSLRLNGQYSTAGAEFNNAVISSDGHWLALRQLDQQSGTTIVLVDTQAGKVVKSIALKGDYDLDAISPDGNALYLLERKHDGSGHYYVELYKVSEGELYQSPIVDKSELNDPNMVGTATARQMSSDGATAYTLYIDPARKLAFVHILPMDPGFPFARCITLPSGTSPDLLRYYTLALSPDGNTLYAANGALGLVTEISLNNNGTSNIYSDNIVATARFNPGALAPNSNDLTRVLRHGAAISPDGSMLYFVGLRGIWSVNTLDLHRQRAHFTHMLDSQSFAGLALSQDARTLYAVDPSRGITQFDATTGQAEQTLQGPARSPWSIEWINN